MGDPVSDFDKLQGRWSGAWEVGGHQISSACLTITNGQANFCGEDYDKFTIDQTKDPKEIDFWAEDVCACKGIYNLDGNVLALNLAYGANDRPQDWAMYGNGSFCFLTREGR